MLPLETPPSASFTKLTSTMNKNITNYFLIQTGATHAQCYNVWSHHDHATVVLL